MKAAYLRQSRIQAGISIVVFGMNITSQVLVLILCGWLVVIGTLSTGVLMAVGNFAATIFNGLVTVAETISQVQSNQQLVTKVSQELRRFVPESHAAQVAFDHVDVQGVSYTYPNGETIAFPDMTITANEKVLFMGESGAGKSTLLKLLQGEYTPTTGEVAFYTKDQQRVAPSELGMAYLPQDPVLFPGTVAENITMFHADLIPAVAEWVPQVALSADIAKLPQGLETPITLDPLNVSGGQRQKIVLARSELAEQEILLMDESTSAIDQAATEQIMARLLSSQKTVICIAHHLTPQLQQQFDRVIPFTKA